VEKFFVIGLRSVMEKSDFVKAKTFHFLWRAKKRSNQKLSSVRIEAERRRLLSLDSFLCEAKSLKKEMEKKKLLGKCKRGSQPPKIRRQSHLESV
jgi:hypothetical protein